MARKRHAHVMLEKMRNGQIQVYRDSSIKFILTDIIQF